MSDPEASPAAPVPPSAVEAAAAEEALARRPADEAEWRRAVLIRAYDVRKRLGEGDTGQNVLHGVNLSIHRGEFCAIVGPSGSGKSTLMYLLGALDRPSSGHIFIDGEDTATLSADALAAVRNRKIGFIFQFHHLMPEFTALENIAIPMLKAGMSRRKAHARALELLADLGLDQKANRLPEGLSGGERQRVGIARSLANKPLIVLGDEPTGNLDTKNAERVFRIFERLTREEGQTIVIVTHDPVLASRTDRIIHVLDGSVVDDGPAREVAARLREVAVVQEARRRADAAKQKARAPERVTRYLRYAEIDEDELGLPPLIVPMTLDEAERTAQERMALAAAEGDGEPASAGQDGDPAPYGEPAAPDGALAGPAPGEPADGEPADGEPADGGALAEPAPGGPYGEPADGGEPPSDSPREPPLAT